MSRVGLIKTWIGIIAFLMGILFVSHPAAGQDIRVYASVDNTEITLEDTIQLSVVVEGVQNAPAPEPPALSDFKVNSGGTSSSLQIVNGQQSASTAFNYQLIPRTLGEFVIEPFKFEINGNPYVTAPIKIKVTQKPPLPAGQAPVFVEAVVSTHQPYLNEQLTLTFRVFHKVDIRNLNLDFSHDRFRKIDLGNPRKYSRVIQGTRYSVFEKKIALFGMRTGKVTLPSAIIELDIVERKTGQAMDSFKPFFDDPFFQNPLFHNQIKLVHKNLRSETIALEVLPLPETNRPKDFTSLVGQFHLSSEINKNELEASDTLTLTLTVSGTGNVADAAPTLPHLKDIFKVYPDQPEFKDTTGDAAVSGTKTFKYALVPIRDGTLTLPPFSLSYFDPAIHAYRTLKTMTHTVNVKPSATKGQLKVVEPMPEGTDVRRSVHALGTDINPIHTDPDLIGETGWSIGTTTAFLFILIVPPLGFVAFYNIYRHRQRLLHDNAYSRRHLAYQQAQERIDHLPVGENGRDTVQELSNIVREYIGNKLNMKGTAFTSRDVEEKLRSENFEERKVLSAKSLLEKYESLQYSSSAHENSESLITESKALLTLLEDQ